MPENKPEKKKVERHWLYAGVIRTRKGRRYGYYDVTDLKDRRITDTDDLLLFSVRIIKRGHPGYVWRVDTEVGEDRMVTAYQCKDWERRVGRWPHEDQVIQWQAASNAAELEIAEESKAAKDVRRRLDLEALEPFVRAYRMATPRQRTYILAEIVKAITQQ